MAEPASVLDRPAAPPARRPRRPLAGLALLLVVLGAALLVGSGAFDGGHQTLEQRAAAFETGIRCPSCQDVSVADSAASSAVAVRHQVLADMRAGESNAQIQATLVDRYGPTIVLRPATSGVAALVWIIPAGAALVAVVALGVLFVRRSRQMSDLKDGAS